MNFSNLTVNNLLIDHVNEISDIWIESIPYNIKSVIGKKIIIKYVEEFIKNEECQGVGLFKENELIGFVFFGEDSKIIKKIFKKNFIYILSSFFLYLIKFNFIKVSNYLDVLLYLILTKLNKNKIKNFTELLIIAIKKNNQNKGYGSHLLKESFIKNKNYFNKFKNLMVITLKSTPENVKFYEKNNFRIFDKIYGRVFLSLNLFT
tara:strand:+ start:804 stop:1418 length:615 start_codon:yes stop_codon:yes gene_type:complete